MEHRINFFLRGIRDWRNIGIGIRMIMTSDEMLKTALVIKWFVAAEHWTLSGGTAQYWLKGLHQTPR